jgi:hypothetical protein
MLEVKTGITDGQNTEVSGAGLEEGADVIIGLASSSGSRARPALRMF